jgi:hypothetical protein
MPTQAQEPSLDIEAVLPQLSQTSSFIHAVALLVLSNIMGENLRDITERVCERHFGTTRRPPLSVLQDSRASNSTFEERELL